MSNACSCALYPCVCDASRSCVVGSVTWSPAFPHFEANEKMLHTDEHLSDRIAHSESMCRKLEQEVANHIDYIAQINSKYEKIRTEFRKFYVERFKPLEKQMELFEKDAKLNKNHVGKCSVCEELKLYPPKSKI